MTPPGRLIGIDHGLKRIGLAVSDASRMVARELVILKRKSKEEDFQRLNNIMREQKITGIVVGLPSNFDSINPNAHTQADTVRLWVQRLQETTPLPVVFWDEQLSSVDAHEIAKQQRRKIGEPVDDLAARVILQSYLDAVRDGTTPPLSASSDSS